MAMQLTRRPEEAADLVQETYLRALRASARFEERGGGIRAWLFTILHNTFYSQVKRAKRGPIAVDEFFDAESSETTPGEAPAAWNLGSLDWEHVDDRLKSAIEDLKDEHRETLLLWGVEGLKYREIADITGVPIGTVMSRLHRAGQNERRMNDDRPNPNPGANDRAIDWSREPVVARLRALADDELPPDHASDLRNEVDAETIARADSFERALRRGCAACMGDAAAPAGLRERVLGAMRADGSDAAAASEAGEATPAVISRTDRSFWTQGRALLGVAAAIAIAAVVWVLAPGGADSDDPAALFATAARHISGEHTGCLLDEDYLDRKMSLTGSEPSDQTGAALIGEQIGDLPVRLELGQAGYVLKGVGGCQIPGGKSVHLLYEPENPAGSRPVSLFIQEATTAQDWMDEGSLYVSELDTPPYVRMWRESGIVYYMVTDCPVSCEKVENAYALSGQRIPL
ncbi:unnamed protein product [Cladocopium goreaui]|uniref:Sigma-70 family RNA polymerase sigma factor n=1 Tax=Cladocopium goreaui TaxID=2562237 RepID=A0A9P1DJK7_9DINO|nr:unnamed protein product [Cladocopium goreaui]